MDISGQRGTWAAGFVDHHTHLLKTAAGVAFDWQGTSIRAFHEQVARDATTPMDMAEQAVGQPPRVLAGRIRRGLARAARVGLVEITEMGVRDWWYLDALASLEQERSLPVRVRVYLASGLAARTSMTELDARRSGAGTWVRVEGIKFYADGWLVPRTCAMCARFADEDQTGLLFADAATLARRIEPFADRGWAIATHAIGDRGIEAVIDAYELAWGNDRHAIAVAAPRIEHGSIVSADLAARIAELGVRVCIQPSFAVTDAPQVPVALGPQRTSAAYPWAMLADLGIRLLAGTDYPIEVIEPLVGLKRLVSGRSDRPGFGSVASAPAHSRLPLDVAMRLSTSAAAGQTFLTEDVSADRLDHIEVLGTAPLPF